MIRYAYIIPLLPLASFFINIAVGKRLPRKGDWLSLATILAGLVMSIGIFLEVFRAYDPNFKYHVVTPWLTVGDRFTLNVGILVDNLTAVMLLVVTGVSTLVHLFSIGYMHGDPRYNRFFAYLSIFSFSMLGLVLSESFFFIYIFWELVGLSSYLLIGFWFEKKSAADACKKAFITNRVGDFGFLIGILIIFATCGVLRVRRGLPGDRRREALGDAPHDRRDRGLLRRHREVGPVPAARLAPRRDGGPHAGLRPDPRGDDGGRGRLPRRAGLPDLHPRRVPRSSPTSGSSPCSSRRRSR